MSGTKQFCTFFIDEFFFGIGVENIQEVLRFQEMTSVPLAPRVVKGFINLRGQIVPAVDLRRRLKLDEQGATEKPMNVVVKVEDEAVSLLVDRIGDVFDVEDSLFEAPPETITGAAKEVISGSYKLPDRLLLVLDIDKVLEVFREKEKTDRAEAIAVH